MATIIRIIFLTVLIALARTQEIDTDCNGQSFRCLDEGQFLICSEQENGRQVVADATPQECPAGTYCRDGNVNACEAVANPETTSTAPTSTSDPATTEESTVQPTEPLNQEASGTIAGENDIPAEGVQPEEAQESEMTPEQVQESEVTPEQVQESEVTQPESAPTAAVDPSIDDSNVVDSPDTASNVEANEETNPGSDIAPSLPTEDAQTSAVIDESNNINTNAPTEDAVTEEAIANKAPIDTPETNNDADTGSGQLAPVTSSNIEDASPPTDGQTEEIVESATESNNVGGNTNEAIETSNPEDAIAQESDKNTAAPIDNPSISDTNNVEFPSDQPGTPEAEAGNEDSPNETIIGASEPEENKEVPSVTDASANTENVEANTPANEDTPNVADAGIGEESVIDATSSTNEEIITPEVVDTVTEQEAPTSTTNEAETAPSTAGEEEASETIPGKEPNPAVGEDVNQSEAPVAGENIPVPTESNDSSTSGSQASIPVVEENQASGIDVATETASEAGTGNEGVPEQGVDAPTEGPNSETQNPADDGKVTEDIPIIPEDTEVPESTANENNGNEDSNKPTDAPTEEPNQNAGLEGGNTEAAPPTGEDNSNNPDIGASSGGQIATDVNSNGEQTSVPESTGTSGQESSSDPTVENVESSTSSSAGDTATTETEPSGAINGNDNESSPNQVEGTNVGQTPEIEENSPTQTEASTSSSNGDSETSVPVENEKEPSEVEGATGNSSPASETATDNENVSPGVNGETEIPNTDAEGTIDDGKVSETSTPGSDGSDVPVSNPAETATSNVSPNQESSQGTDNQNPTTEDNNGNTETNTVGGETSTVGGQQGTGTSASSESEIDDSNASSNPTAENSEASTAENSEASVSAASSASSESNEGLVSGSRPGGIVNDENNSESQSGTSSSTSSVSTEEKPVEESQGQTGFDASPTGSEANAESNKNEPSNTGCTLSPAINDGANQNQNKETVAPANKPSTTASPPECVVPGPIAHESDCRKYYVCLLGTQGYQRVELICQDRSAYSPRLQRCTRDVSRCGGSACTVNGLLPDPANPARYYWCIRNIYGSFHKYHVQCPRFEIFSTATGRCQIDLVHYGNSAGKPNGDDDDDDDDDEYDDEKAVIREEKERLKEELKQKEREEKQLEREAKLKRKEAERLEKLREKEAKRKRKEEEKLEKQQIKLREKARKSKVDDHDDDDDDDHDDDD